MNNRGFTLIELIVTILLLSVISVISYVSVTNIIKTGNKKNCLTLVNNIKAASKEYVSDNRYKSDFTSRVNSLTVTINASDLIDGAYLTSPIINPLNREEINPEEITISVELNANYTVSEIEVSGIDCDL